MTPTWYDLLGVDPDADPAEIRTAWKAGIADLEPGDRRFETLNRAAKVLLDPVARAEYDASLAPEHDQPAEVVEEGAPAPVVEEGRSPVSKPEGLVTGLRPSSTSGGGGPSSTSGGGGPSSTERPSGRVLAALAVLALVMAAVTAWAWLNAGTDGADEPAFREAQQAAEEAVVPVLSYDYRQLEQDQERAQALMTGSYREDYDKIFAVIEENAPRLRTKVDVSVVASGIVRASDDRVQVLVFVDRPTTNKQQREPVVYKDQVTLTMQQVDGEWLVDGMVTSPVPQ